MHFSIFPAKTNIKGGKNGKRSQFRRTDEIFLKLIANAGFDCGGARLGNLCSYVVLERLWTWIQRVSNTSTIKRNAILIWIMQQPWCSTKCLEKRKLFFFHRFVTRIVEEFFGFSKWLSSVLTWVDLWFEFCGFFRIITVDVSTTYQCWIPYSVGQSPTKKFRSDRDGYDK